MLLTITLTLSVHAAPKLFPYCVKSSPAELKALGYDGCEIPFVIGPELDKRIKAADEAKMIIAKTYITHDLQKPFPVEKLEAFMTPLKGRETVIEFALTGYPAGAPEGVEPTVKLLKELGELAGKYQLRIALYNHIKTYCESVPFAIEIVDKVNLPNVGYCFIVCHWLHMEGAKDYRPLLKANPKKLFMVGTNGATVELKGWNNLICPLDVGNFDNAQLLQTLEEIKYPGLVGLQCFGIKLPEGEHLKRSMDAWRKLAGAGQQKEDLSKTASVATAGQATDEAAWQPLFNGTDLSGWTVQCKPKDQGKSFWQVDAGTILCDSLGRPDHDYCWLVSDKEYGDFELRLKFQATTHSPGNSGIQFRSRYDKDDQGGWLNGPQVDIHPPASQSWRTGLIYDETRGEQRWVSPSLPNSRIGAEHKLAGHVFKYANEGDGWNDLLLIANGNRIKTVVNGVVCTDWDGAGTLDNAAHRAKNVGSRGHFALQLHVKDQLRIRFKDIAIHELDSKDAAGKAVMPAVACVKAEMPIEWPDFMRQHDMTFNTLPRNWKEAPHFGNAMVGSMLYQVEDTLRLQIFRADVQDHRDDTWGWTAYSRPRLMIGHFSLHPVGKLTGCAWRKDLWNAELTGTITTDKGEIKIRHVTHAVDMAIVTELTPSEGEKGFTWTWHPAPAKTTRSGYPTNQQAVAEFAKRYAPSYASTLKVWEPNPPGRLEKEGEKSIWIQDLLKGGQYATAWCEQSKDETRSLLVTIAKSYPESTAATRAKADLNRFCAEEPKAWFQGHQAWWHAYYQQSFLTIPDKRLESLYWQMIYRYGCTSRTGRSMVDTSGLWFQGAQWPYITTDWNIQSAHWAVYTANRLEQGEEVVNRLHEGREALIKAVRPVEWQKDSAYLALAVAPDMKGARDEDMRYYNLLGNLPWTLHNAWMQYRYSMDDAMLRDKIYPLLRRSMNLYLHIVEEGKDGKLHLPPTYSPESGLWKDCAFDLALFKWGCLTLLKASKRLGIEDPLIPRWRDVATRLVDFPVCEKGFSQGSDKPLLEGHRHLSHLLMIYPLYLANIEQKGMWVTLMKSMQQSLALNSSDHNAAMVQTHAVPIATALGEGGHALKGLAFHQADLLPNGLWACAGNPCIESTLSLANNIQEMLLQSWCDPAKNEPVTIRLFPALPPQWQDVEFHDLRTEGAFLVSAKRAGGKTQWVKIKSLAGEPCRIRTYILEPSLISACPMQSKQLAPGLYEIKMEKGDSVVLVPVAQVQR